MQRYMNDKALESFHEDYREHLYKEKKHMRKPNQNDTRILSHLKKTQSVSETAKALGVSHGKVIGAAARLSVYSK